VTRYVIIGAGAVGVTLAAELQRSGRQVVLVGRGRQLELLRSGQLRYVRPDGVEVLDVPAAGDPGDVRLHNDDVLILSTKTQQAEAALTTWSQQPVDAGRWRAGEVLPILTVQNGLDVERAALRRFRTVVGSVLLTPATYEADGEVVSPAAPAPAIFWIGSYPDAPASRVATSIAVDLGAAGCEVQVVDDLSRWKAGKLLGSVTFVLDALYPAAPERDRAAKLLQAEASEVLAAAGVAVADLRAEGTQDFSRFVARPIEGYRRQGNSTYQSLARARDVETDFLNGEVVLLARQNGRRAPVNAALQARVQRAVQEGVEAGSLPVDDLARTLAATVVVDVETLKLELDGAQPPALLDVRWTLGDDAGEKDYLDGHLPGAVYVDLDTELAAPASVGGGRHPLPDVADLQEAARRWGLRAGQAVVVYDDNGGLGASRAWWVLRWAGVSDVRILDGGLGAWRSSGGALVSGAERLRPGDVELSAGHLPVLDDDAAATLPAHGVLIDARAAERYRGEVEPIDTRAGHVPGAISLPTSANLDEDGRFLPIVELRERLAAAVGATDVGVYCGSGVSAAHEIAALRLVGVDAALYPGSWSAWSADPSRPAATGASPS
jgi:thiosulfate/3-mercaptopyruvate sulfurtransferase